jgi:hypothetical protein
VANALANAGRSAGNDRGFPPSSVAFSSSSPLVESVVERDRRVLPELSGLAA